MSSSLPYIIHNSENEFNYDVELALAYMLSKRDNDPVFALVKAYYPFKVFETNEGLLFFDLHGKSEGETPLLVCSDINEAIKGFTDLEEEERYGLLNSCKKLLEDHHSESMEVKSLVDEIEIINYLRTSEKETFEKTHRLFPVTVTENKFHERFKNVEKARKNTKDILGTHIKARKYLESTKNKIEKLHEKQYKSLLKESEKTLDKNYKKQVKEIDCLEKKYKTEIITIEKDFDTKIEKKKKECQKIIDEIEEINYEEKDSIKLIKKENKIEKINKSIEGLEKKRANKIDIKTKKKDANIEKLAKELEKKRLKETKKQEKVKKQHNKLEEAIVELLDKQNNIITLLEEEENTLSILINLSYHEGEEILVPFYVYGKEDGYGYHPPIKNIGEKGLSVFLKGLLENSLANKIRKQVSPDTLVFNKYIEPLVTVLNDDEYKDGIKELDLLSSRDSLILLLVGLNRLYDWGWINDKEYIQAQKQIIERIKDLMTDSIKNPEADIVRTTISQEQTLDNL